MKNKGIQAFISYRRSSGREVARNIYERLSLNGINTFFDYNSMRNGKFNEQIYDAIEQANDFIFILSPDALDRCSNTDDWVRIELEHALKHNKNIIIVSTQQDIKFPENLPDSLKELPRYHAMTLNQEYYEESIARLINMLSCGKQNEGNFTDFLKKQQKKLLLFSTILFIGIIVLTIYKHVNNQDTKIPPNNSGLTAKIYLPRYADLDREILNDVWFSEDNLKIFEYIDTIIDSSYYILPCSKYFTNNVITSIFPINSFTPFYHNLPLRLSIHNTKSDTQVIDAAELEVMDIHPISTPVLSIYPTQEGFKIVSQIKNYNPEYSLSYSPLLEGESFTGYKINEDITSLEHYIKLKEPSSARGKISFGNKTWFFSLSNTDLDNEFKYSENKTNTTISPASSNVKVFNIEINNDEPSNYPIEGIDRKIVTREVDDDMYIILSSTKSFDARLRVKLTTVRNSVIFTEPITIRYIHPDLYENKPF